MAKRLFGLYLIVELAVVIALAYAIGLGWTILLLLGTFAVGLALAGSQLTRQVQRLRTGFASPQEGATDGLLIALGVVLTVVPGLVTSLLGLALLLPPTRMLARPAVTALAARGLGRMPLFVTTTGAYRPARGDYVDGEVIDVTDVSDPADRSAVEVPQLPGTPSRPPV